MGIDIFRLPWSLHSLPLILVFGCSDTGWPKVSYAQMLGFNFNSTTQQYDAASTELRKSRDSIKITK